MKVRGKGWDPLVQGDRTDSMKRRENEDINVNVVVHHFSVYLHVLPSIMCFLDSPLSVSALMGQTQTSDELHSQSVCASGFVVFSSFLVINSPLGLQKKHLH